MNYVGGLAFTRIKQNLIIPNDFVLENLLQRSQKSHKLPRDKDKVVLESFFYENEILTEYCKVRILEKCKVFSP